MKNDVRPFAMLLNQAEHQHMRMLWLKVWTGEKIKPVVTFLDTALVSYHDDTPRKISSRRPSFGSELRLVWTQDRPISLERDRVVEWVLGRTVVDD